MTDIVVEKSELVRITNELKIIQEKLDEQARFSLFDKVRDLKLDIQSILEAETK